MFPSLVVLLAVSDSYAEEVLFTSISDGAEVHSPVFGMAINGMVVPPPLPGVAYTVTIKYPGGLSEVVTPDVGGFWHSAAPYDLPKPATEEASGVFRPFVAELSVVTPVGVQLRDRDVINLVDTSTFALEHRDDRTVGEPEGIAYKVTATGVDAFDRTVFDAVAAQNGFSINDALSSLGEVSGLAAAEDSCVTTLTAKELNTVWSAIVSAVAFVDVGAGAVLKTLSTATEKLATLEEICVLGMTPVIEEILVDPITTDLSPVNGGIGVSLDPDNTVWVEASGRLETGAIVTIDLSDYLDPSGETKFTVPITIKPCAFTFDGDLSGADLTYPLAASGLEFLVLDGAMVEVSSDPSGYFAGGVCGWGIFDGLLQKSRDNVESTVEQTIDEVLDVPADTSGIAEALDLAWRDVEGSNIDVISIDETFLIATGTPLTHDPDPFFETGGLEWMAATSADGDLGGATDYYWQEHTLEMPEGGVAVTTAAEEYDIAIALTTASVNQSLSAGADSTLMDFEWKPTWNDLGLCAKAPAGTDCTKAIALSGTTLTLLSPKLKKLPSVRLEYTPVIAPVTFMQSFRQCDAEVFFALASYKMRLVDVVSGAVWLEVTTGGAGTFEITLTGPAGDYVFKTPAAAHQLTRFHEGLGVWPAELAFVNAIRPLLTPMMDQATAALDTWSAPEFQSVDAIARVVQVDQCNELGTMYRYSDMR